MSSVVTAYLLDVHPSLVKVLAAATGGNTTRFVQEPRGLLAQEDSAGNWVWLAGDGLGSVRDTTIPRWAFVCRVIRSQAE